MRNGIVEDILGNIAKIEMGQSPDSKYYNSDSKGLPLIQGNADIKDRKSISRIWTTQITKECDEGDILMTVRAPVGKIGISSYHSCIGRGVCAFKAINVDSNYLYYLLLSKEESWQIYEQGSTFTAVGSKEIFNFPLTLITLVPEQTQIANILNNCDIIIEKTQAAISKYKAIKQGMLQDLFTRGIDIKTGKLRPRYEDAPELYKESKLGWIPKEWDEIPLENLTTQIGDGIHTTPKYSENTDYYFINGNNLSNGKIEIPNSALCISKEEYKKLFKELNNRTILYSINGTIGNIAFYEKQKVVLGKSVCYISCKTNVNLDYIYFILQTNPVIKYYENELTGSTIKNLSLASVRNTPITISKEIKEQELIANRIRTITSKLQMEQIYFQKLQAIKQGLMSDLLTGKKRVKIEEILNKKNNGRKRIT